MDALQYIAQSHHMVTTFGNSEWVTQAAGKVQSKSVTSCAGMTAHLVLQTSEAEAPFTRKRQPSLGDASPPSSPFWS